MSTSRDDARPIRTDTEDVDDAAAGPVPNVRAFGEDDQTSFGGGQWFQALTNLAPQIVWSTRPDGYYDYFNDRWYEFTGMPRIGDQGWNWKDYLHADDIVHTLEAWHDTLATGKRYDVRYRIRRASDGEYRWFIARAIPLLNAKGEIVRWFGTCTDIHHERSTELRLERLADFRRSLVGLVEESLTASREEEFYQRVLESAVRVVPGAEGGSILIRDPDGMFEYVASVGYDLDRIRTIRLTRKQAAFETDWATRTWSVLGLTALDPFPPEQQAVLESAGRLNEIRASLKVPIVLDGVVEAFLTLDSFSAADAFSEEATEISRIFAGHVATLMQRFRLQQDLHRLAYEDVLTGLPNRAALERHAEETLAQARENGEAVAFLFMDLDGFKDVNDQRGHAVGDVLLEQVARRLEEGTRSEDYVARLGGDEFVVVLGGDAPEPIVRTVADRVLQALARPIELPDGTIHASTSIGVAFFPSDGDTLQEVLRSADFAMYQAKARGKNTYCIAVRGTDSTPRVTGGASPRRVSDVVPNGDGSGRHRELQALLDHGREGKLLADEAGAIRYANGAAAETFGRQPGTLSGRNVFDLIEPDDVAARAALLERVRNDPHAEHVAIVRLRADDGATRDVEALIGPWSTGAAERGLLVSVNDVTRRMHAQRVADAHEARYRDLFDHSADGMVRTAPDGRIFEMNAAFLGLLGYTREEAAALGLHRDDVLDTGDPRLPAALEERHRTGRVRAELNMRHKSGALVPTELTSNVYVDADGEERSSIVVRDMSDRQRSERALQDHLTHLADAECAALVMVAHADLDGHWIKVPPALCTLLGYSERELLSTSLHDITHPDDRAETARNLDLIRDGAITSYTMEKRYLHKEGHAVWVHLSLSVAHGAAGRALHSVVYVRDMTAKKAAGERVLRAYALLLKDVTRLAERVGLAEDHAEIYRALLDLARTTTPADSLIVSHLEPRSGVRTCVFLAEIFDGRYVEADAGQLPTMPPSDSPQSRAVRERRTIFTDELLEETMASIDVGADDDDRPARSSLAIPLIVLGEVIGVFELQSTTPAAFQEEHHAQLQIAASLAAIAIKNLDVLTSERAARKRAEVESVRLAEVLELAPILTAALAGPEHVFVTANAKYARFFGGRQLVGRRVVDVMPEIEAQGVIAILDRVLASGESYHSHEMTMELDTAGHGDLSRHYFDLVYQPLRDGRSIHGVLAQAVDITAQVQARKNAEKLTASLQAAYDETIAGWARALDLKDEETAGHSQRVTDLTLALCHQMDIPDEDLADIRRGALLHDIGKMGVPDRILLKPGALDAEEWSLMKRHAEYARELLEPIEHLRTAIDIPYCHHEKWDGSGYPRGLVSTDIPVAAQIFAVVDVYDALTSERPYRSAWTRDQALAHIAAGKGTHFAPDVVDAFLNLAAPGRLAPEGS